MKKTIDYYNKHAGQFVESTVSVDLSMTQDLFLSLIPKQGRVLDFGCGSGRDSRYFLDHGFETEALDGSQAMVEAARRLTGLPVRQMLFQDLNEKDRYDGIWACSSILHLPRTELKEVLEKMAEALHTGGVIYTSFKYSNFEGMRNERYFTDFTEQSFREFMTVQSLSIEKEWITGDARPGRGDEKWLNLILRKK